MSLQPPVQIILRFQGNEEDLDVLGAFAKHPDVVCDAILDAVRLIKPRKNDITLLAIESDFWDSLEGLKEPWGQPRVLQLVLDACRQGCLGGTTECDFYEQGGVADVVALAVATARQKSSLLRRIDALPKKELTRLIRHVNKMPKGAVVAKHEETFITSKPGPVSNPPPRLFRRSKS